MQRVEVDFKGPVRKIEATDDAHTPSWSSISEGFAKVTLTKHERAGWLTIAVLESRNADHAQKRGSIKETMVTLDEAAATDLYYALRRMFEMVKCSRCGERPAGTNGMVNGPTGTPGRSMCEACMEG